MTAPPPDILGTLETYYDAAPRASATTEEHGPFTVFLQADQDGFPFYARPRLGLDAEVTPDDVRRVRERQRQLGAPEAFEWVHETTPSLRDAARDAGLVVEDCPLLVLDGDGRTARPSDGFRVAVLGADDPDLATVLGAVSAAFAGSDEVAPKPSPRRQRLIREGLVVTVGAYDPDGRVVGGGSHSPRGGTTELTGIGVLPGVRRRGLGEAVTRALVADARERGVGTAFLSAQDDAVARIYQRAGFARVGTACIGSAP